MCAYITYMHIYTIKEIWLFCFEAFVLLLYSVDFNKITFKRRKQKKGMVPQPKIKKKIFG